jgi:hypothetical protein
MEIAACGGDGDVAERLLDEMNGCPAIEAVGMAQPKGMPLVYSREQQLS